MFKIIENLLSAGQIRELHAIADTAQFVDGRISNPHNTSKNNLQIHDSDSQQKSVAILARALVECEEFRDFCFPAQLAPPLLARYDPDMHYGMHPDAAIMQLPQSSIRADISCTIFLDEPDTYDGGELHISLGDGDVRIKGKAGSAVLYPSHTLHEVEKVTRGRRLVAITFIQSQVQDSHQRQMLYELGEVAALEGTSMSPENYTRLRAVQFNLQRMWAKI